MFFRQTSHNIEIDLTTQAIQDKEEDHSETRQNPVSEDNFSCSHFASQNTDNTDEGNQENQDMAQQNMKESRLNSGDGHQSNTENTADVNNSDPLESGCGTETSSTDRKVSDKENGDDSQDNILQLQRKPDSERNQANIREQEKGSEASNFTDAPNIVFKQSM